MNSASAQGVARALILAIFGLTMVACPPDESVIPDQPPTQRPVAAPQLDRLGKLEAQIKLVAGKAICLPEVRGLIQLIKHECGVTTKCSAKDIKALMTEVEPHERFMWVMREVPHVVVYLALDFDRRSASDAIVAERQDRLRRLLQPPWLDFGQILIIGHGGARETMKDLKAQARAQRVQDFILGLRFEGGQRISPARVLAFPYSFPLRLPTAKQQNPGLLHNDYLEALELLNKNILLKKDMPISGEPQDDPGFGVWVFLVDCPSEE